MDIFLGFLRPTISNLNLKLIKFREFGGSMLIKTLNEILQQTVLHPKLDNTILTDVQCHTKNYHIYSKPLISEGFNI